MLKVNHGWVVLIFVSLLVGLEAATARGQTGPELLIKPWPRDRIIEADAQADFYNETNTNNPSNDGSGRAVLSLSEYDSEAAYDSFHEMSTSEPIRGLDTTSPICI